MGLSIRQSAILVAAVAVVCFGAYGVLFTWRLVGDALNEESARLRNRKQVAFELTDLQPHTTTDVRIRQTTAETRDIVRFRGSIFAATSGGLVEFDEDGRVVRRYSVLDGLPESDLTTIAVFRDTLFIGTRSAGVVTFDGEMFRGYRFIDRKTQSINAFLPMPGELLIGTFDGGLLAFDGAAFTEIAPDASIKGVTTLAGDGSELFVGTFADGLWVRRGAVWAHFTVTDGLPSNRVVSAFKYGDKIYAATDLGLALIDDGRSSAAASLANVTSAVATADGILLSVESGGVYSADPKPERIAGPPSETRNARLAVAGGSVFFLSDDGIMKFENRRLTAFGDPEKDDLTSNFVSAVAVDQTGSLWVGTFRRGLDVFSPEGRRLTHIETPETREVNFLAAGKTVRAATSKGLIEFDRAFEPRNLLAGADLPSLSLTHFSGDLMASAKGLAERDRKQFRLWTAQNGLPSNSTYAIHVGDGRTYVGTLGGLAEIVNGRVERTFRDSNSKLDTNWVTALTEVRGRLFIGTYGGGIFELLPSSEIRSFRAETGKFVVNPNAFAGDGRRLYAGTLDGLQVYDLETQKWTRVANVLPSPTVMSVAVTDDGIVVGTSSGIAFIRTNFFESL